MGARVDVKVTHTKKMQIACIVGIAVACGRASKRTGSDTSANLPASQASTPSAPASPSATHSSAAKAPKQSVPGPVEPTLLVKLSISAYSTSLALDEHAVYLLTSNAAYRLVPGQNPQGFQLDLGFGAILTRTSFIFWSKGAIWRAPKQGGPSSQLAKFPHQPQYFITSGDQFAWIDRTDEGLFTIQTLGGQKPRILLSTTDEITALNMINDWIFFVHRPVNGSWRIGRLPIAGGEPAYTSMRSGNTPAMLAVSDDIFYYDMSKSEIHRLVPDLRNEETLLKDLVCSPVAVATQIYCGCVEGLFEVSKELHTPRVLIYGRRASITDIKANANFVAWTSDLGPNKLAVEMLPALGANGNVAVKPQ